jgi:hypothetical protein
MPLESKAGRSVADGEPSSVQTASHGGAVDHCRVWLNWAAMQLNASLANDSLANHQLLVSLGDLLGEAQPRSETLPPTGGDTISGKMSAVIIAVQAHDRVVQELSHVIASLRALHEQLGDMRHADSAESWRLLREKQFRAFTMADERELFARLVGHEGESGREAAINPEDTVELFTGGLSPHEP